MSAPLSDIRILDFSRVLAGPFCTMLLADFGAEVIKIEQPEHGDDTRHWGPPWAGELSAYYLSVNRNKYSVTLNLKTPEGQQIARDLIPQCDVLLENFKVGGMAEYGLDYASVQQLNPTLVYCSITGYGQTGPYAHRPGYDYVIQAQSGLMSITGPENGEPYKVGVAITDVLTGLFAANAIQTALRHRDQTGQGQYVDISLLDSQLAALVNVASNYLVSNTPPARYGNAHPNIVPYGAFQAADGYFILNVGNDSQFKAACEVMACPELASDDRFATNPARVQNRAILMDTLQAILSKQTCPDWVERFIAAGVPASPINTIPEALSDPQVQAREMVQPMTLADGTFLEGLGIAPKLSATPGTIRRPPPLLGQDTDNLLKQLLGITPAQLATFREQGII